MSLPAVVKLAAFLWAAGERAFFADVPPLSGETAHWQCDEWAAMPRFREMSMSLGRPTGPGVVEKDGVGSGRDLYTRSFASGARVVLDMGYAPGKERACITWADNTTSGYC